MTENKDYSYHCADCDNYGLCNYYSRRKPTSKICKEFQNKWKMISVLKDIRAELTKAYVDPYNRNAFRYTTVSLLNVLDLIDKHLKEFED